MAIYLLQCARVLFNCCIWHDLDSTFCPFVRICHRESTGALQPVVWGHEFTASHRERQIERKDRRACGVLRLLYTEAAEWVASLAHACRAGLNCVGQADESRGALWGERKSSQEGEAGLLAEPLQSHFYVSERLSLPPLFAFWLCNIAFVFQREKSDCFWSKHQHHGAALPRNGHHYTSSSRSESPGRWQSPAELVDYRGEISTAIFLF